MLRLAALAALAAAASAQQPEQVHIAVTGKPGELSIDFVSHQVNCSGFGVMYGTSPSTMTTYVPSYNCTNFASMSPLKQSWSNQVLLTGLQTNTTYYYICGSPNFREPWSQVFSTTFMPAKPEGYSFAVYADFGYYNAESLPTLIADAAADKFQFVLHAGDHAYDLDAYGGEIGDEFMRMIEPFASAKPYMPGPGNHEVDGQTFGQYIQRYRSVADQAGVNSGSNSNLFYSFDVTEPTTGLTTHILNIDTESWWAASTEEQQAQLAFIKADLAKIDRTAVPWVIAMGHKAYYMDNTIEPPSGNGSAIWDLLQQGGVDIYFTGHVHEYRRFYPIDPSSNSQDTNCSNADHSVYTNPKYFAMVISAAPGNQEVNANGHLSHKVHKGASEPPKDGGITSVTSSNNYGYGILWIPNATHARWTWTTAVPHVNSTDPTYSDEFWIVQENHGPRPPTTMAKA